MAKNKQQSSIKEARDQLFLDTADGTRLDIVTSNLGLDRPIVGLDDDEWRALAKQVALKPKQIRNIFYRIMEVCVGPKTTRTGVISLDSLAGEDIIQLEDASDLIQLGTLIFDPGQATEESVQFCFRDLETNKVFLNSELQFSHNSVSSAATVLIGDHVIGSGSLSVFDSKTFPITGFPYSIIVERGTEREETLVVTANDTLNNMLTLQDPTTILHQGSRSTYVRKSLLSAAPAGRTFITLDNNETRVFPAVGYVRLSRGVAPTGSVSVPEGAEFVDGETIVIGDGTNTITFELDSDATLVNITATPITFTGSETKEEMADLVAAAINASVLRINAVIGTSGPSTVDVDLTHRVSGTAGNVAITDTVVSADFTVSGMSGGTGVPEEVVEFIENQVDDDTLQLKTPLQGLHAAGNSVELVTPPASVETCSVIQRFADWEIFETSPRQVTVYISEEDQVLTLRDASYLHDATLAVVGTTLDSDLNLGDVEISVVDSSGLAKTGVVTISGDDIFYIDKDDTTNTLFLPEPSTVAAGATTAVTASISNYGGTDLEEGNVRDSSGDVQEQFSGPYIYNIVEQAPTNTSGLLAETLPPHTRVVFDQIPGRTALEVADASDWPTPPFTPFPIRIGAGTGSLEDNTATDVTLRKGLSTTVNANTSIGASSLPVADTAGFPQSNGANPARYRIIVDEGNSNEEILLVSEVVSGAPGSLTLVSPTAVFHSSSETVTLMADVITTDVLQQPHAAETVSPTVEGEKVEKLAESLTLSTGAGLTFPNSGTVYLNFGKEKVNARQKLTAVGPTVLGFADTSSFPTVGYPYKIVIAEGTPGEEVAFVNNNDTGTNELTISSAPSTTPTIGQYVTFTAGTPTTVTYVDKDVDVLEFAVPTSLPSGYTLAERVTLTSGPSEPDDEGNDYAFLLPPSVAGCLEFMFDLVRAAGVEIVFITNR